jgi:hypothetical protein
MVSEPRYDDFVERGLAVVFLGPLIAVLCLIVLPFAALGWVSHRLGWTVEGDPYEGQGW